MDDDKLNKEYIFDKQVNQSFEKEDATANSKQIEILKKHFPQAFDEEGNYLPNKIEEIVKSSEIEISKEGYSLNWLGKAYSRLLANEDPLTLMSEDVKHNATNKDSENVLIQGDNLEVLKHLQEAYSEKVKMIYIDPPYNTGSDGFVYNDTRKYTVENLMESLNLDQEEAQRILEFTNSKSSSHSAWLTFMYPRLKLARELLRDDGVIFISIDDNEQAQLKLLCDEIFGEDNVESMIWNKEAEGASGTLKQTLRFRSIHETIIVGYKDKKNIKFKKISDPIKGKENNLKTANLAVNKDQEKENHRNWMEITSPTGKKWYKHWKFDNNEIKRLMSDDLIYWGKDGSRQPRLILPTDERRKVYATSIINKGGTTLGRKDFEENMEKSVFSYPKPLSLISFLLKIYNNKKQDSDLILDFFAGSGTTAHSVMQLNAEDGGNRKFMMVQLDEPCDPKSEAKKAGYDTIFDICKERVIRSGKKIKEENPLFSGDLGFKIYKTVPFPDKYDEDIKELYKQNTLFDSKTVDSENLKNFLTTYKLYDGFEINQEFETIKIDAKNKDSYTSYKLGENLYLIDKGFDIDHLKSLLLKIDNDKDFVISKIILFGYNFTTQEQRNLSEALHSFKNKKSIDINLIIRY